MANIKELIESIESTDSSFDDKLEAITKMEETLVAMRQQEEEAINDNVELIVEAIKVMENKVSAQLEIAKSIVPEKGDKGDKGADGKQGKDGRDGKDGKDGINGKDGADGKDGVSVRDAKIDFDGSLIITLSTGQELNVGEVVAPDLAEKIKVISTMSTNGAVAVLDEGTSITSGVKSLNFVGSGVTATTSGDNVTVTVAGGGSGTVTSVAATVPSFLSVTGSPITTSGTLAITLSGTALPIANGGTGATTLAGASIATYSGTETLTNKRIDPRVTSAASASSLTPDISASDVYAYTALAEGLTINAPTGTPLDGDKLIFRLLDNGTSRSLTWNATYTDLVVVFVGKNTTANVAMTGEFDLNGDGGNNYSGTYLGDGATSGRGTNNNGGYYTTLTRSSVSTAIVHFMNYSNSTTYKTWLSRWGTRGGSDNINQTGAIVGLWRNTAAITEINFNRPAGESGSFDVGCTWTLYGIKAA